MREIKFRGKSVVENKWVYGYYVSNDCGNHFIKEVKSPEGMICYREIEVDPDTVCEFTGLYDKNGKEIYEGDIIKTQPFVDHPYTRNHKSKQFLATVYYDARTLSNTNQGYEACWDAKIKEDVGNYRHWDWGIFYNCEVVGNIYDNPELVGE